MSVNDLRTTVSYLHGLQFLLTTGYLWNTNGFNGDPPPLTLSCWHVGKKCLTDLLQTLLKRCVGKDDKLIKL